MESFEENHLLQNLSALPLDEFLETIQQAAKAREIDLRKMVSDRQPNTKLSMPLSAHIVCPDCGSSRVVKNGKRKGVQRYLCKACNRRFTSFTGTLFENNSMPWTFWVEAVYSLCNGMPIKRFQDEINRIIVTNGKRRPLDYKTCWSMRMRIMHALAQIEQPTLSGIVQLGVLHLRESQKGSRCLVNVLPDELGGRQPRRGQTVSRLGYTGSEFVSILVGIDSSNQCASQICSLGAVDERSVEKFFADHMSGVDCICSASVPIFMRAFKDMGVPHHIAPPQFPHSQRRAKHADLASIEETLISIKGMGHDRAHTQLLNAKGSEDVLRERIRRAGAYALDDLQGFIQFANDALIKAKRNISIKHLPDELGFLVYLQNWKGKYGVMPTSRKDSESILHEAASVKATFSTKELARRRQEWVDLPCPSDDYLIKLDRETEHVRAVTCNAQFKFVEEDDMAELDIRSLLDQIDIVRLRRFAFICFGMVGADRMTKAALVSELLNQPDISRCAYLYLLNDSVLRADAETLASSRKCRLIKQKTAGFNTALFQRPLQEVAGNVIFVELTVVDFTSPASEILEMAIKSLDGKVLFSEHMQPVGGEAWEHCRKSLAYQDVDLVRIKPFAWYKPELEAILNEADFICSYRSDFVRRTLVTNDIDIPRKDERYFTVDSIMDRLSLEDVFPDTLVTYAPTSALEGTDISMRIFKAAQDVFCKDA